ncbi:DDE superfamily endonuclease [Phytophthora infestans]|uniref:DDE superfamily endonuclease n=1 Tax=Phytophthora infestans TaxID=4787 RepID=A0A833TEQ7_PHYIN|nr:DDE superfamily endonuclease [Phytophthora infestans]KAF4137838.1 DDE superfamily endonuclease [Phytophthora infestans]
MPSTVPSSFKAAHPYFDQALCAIDGTHFSIVVPSEDIKRYRNHKGFVFTNVLFAYDWSMNVCFIYPGAEGSAQDSMALQWRRFLDMLPENFYVLADAGFALSPQVLTPYRGVRSI